MNFDTFISKELCPEDYQTLLPYFKMRYSHTCENILVSNFMWKDYYNTRYIRDAHGLIWIMDVDGQPGTMVPLCAPEDLKHYFEVAQAYFNECLGTKMILYLADKEAVDLLRLDTTRYDVKADRRYFDYVYDARKLMSFSGKAYHKKKNHVNAFMKNYDGRYEYRSLERDSKYHELPLSGLQNGRHLYRRKARSIQPWCIWKSRTDGCDPCGEGQSGNQRSVSVYLSAIFAA